MIRMVFAALVLAVAPVSPAPVGAQPVQEGWPCVQRKVERLSIGQMWTGPLPETLPDAALDAEIEALADRIAPRRTSQRMVESLVAAVGASDAASREERLAALFGAVFEAINRQRTRLVAGVTRYAEGQRALSERIDAIQAELAALEAEARPDDYDALDRADALRDALALQLRIFEERRSALLYVCESPVLLERRAFEIARIVAAAIEDG